MPRQESRREFGLGRGKVFPAARAGSLVSPLRRLVQSPRRTIAAMGLEPASRVLEVGAGPGFFSPHLAAAARQGSLVVLDLQVEMLRRARDRVEGQPTTHLVQGDAIELPLRSGVLDGVLVATVLGEVPDVHRCLWELRRVLRRGGVASFAETRRDSDFVGATGLRRLVEAHSFEFMDRHGPRWQYLARFRAI